MNARFLDWIWHIKGSLPIAPGQSSDEVFDRLSPLFQEINTTHDRTGDTLTFNKWDQAAQDKMSVFDGGTLTIESGVGAGVLRYHMTSKALLYCFLAPLLFLAIAAATIGIGKLEKSPDEAGKAKKEEKKEMEVRMNPIDKFLGAPAPEKKDDKAKKAKEKEEEKEKGPDPTPAYAFAGIFAAVYLVGRILEDRLIRSLFRKTLTAL
ncbi:hypothetical protein [Sphingobium sp. CR28]|uniref:hypothetical protein n=1 Tax=Sphingobium sp. CR28 TaxID=3400272 RepID=UPI003FEE491F